MTVSERHLLLMEGGQRFVVEGKGGEGEGESESQGEETDRQRAAPFHLVTSRPAPKLKPDERPSDAQVDQAIPTLWCSYRVQV